MASRKTKAAAPEAEAPVEEDLILDSNGQMLLPLDGTNYVLRPSWLAIQSIERQLRPLLQLTGAACAAALSIDEMAIIACEMMKAYGAANPNEPGIANYKGATPDRLGELIYEAGAPRICARLMVVLSGAVNGGYTASGEAKAAVATTGKSNAP